MTFGEDAESHRSLADIYAGYQGDPAEMWARVDQAFGAQGGARLRLTGQLAYLTVNNGPLISALFQAAGDTPITAVSDLVAHGYHKAESWLPLIAQATVPAEIPGSDADEKAANYAELLAAQVRLSFPTAVIGQLVRDGTVPVLGGAELQAAVAGFLAASQGEFDIGGEPIVRYLARSGVESGLDQAAIDQITRVQRVYQMTQNSRALAGLLRAGVDSAYAVTRHTQAAFRTTFASTVGGEEAANAIYAQARTIYASTLSLTLGYLGARLAPALGSASTGLIIDPFAGHAAANGAAGAQVGPPLPPVPIFAQATLEELFGNLDYCACDDCQSITGPAAYLVDLLDFIDILTPAVGFQNPQTVLLGRRPDIAALPLTCDNTNIALPYIDLVNETLEYFVANALLAGRLRGTQHRRQPVERRAQRRAAVRRHGDGKHRLRHAEGRLGTGAAALRPVARTAPDAHVQPAAGPGRPDDAAARQRQPRTRRRRARAAVPPATAGATSSPSGSACPGRSTSCSPTAAPCQSATCTGFRREPRTRRR